VSLRSQLGLDDPGTDQETQPGLPVLSLCWDPLFAFLIRFLKPLRPRKPVVVMNSLEAETITSYKLLLSWEIPVDYEGILNEISLYTSSGAKGLFFVQVADQVLFKDRKILSQVLTLPWKELPLIAGNKVIVAVKTTDGTATDFDGTITGELRYLARR